MISFAFRTLPFTNSQRQRIVDISADVTPLAGRKESVKSVYRATVPLALVLKHVRELIPSSVRDRLGKMMIPDHVPNSEVFNVYRLVIADKLSACLMKKITSLIRNLLMLHCKFIENTAENSLLQRGDECRASFDVDNLVNMRYNFSVNITSLHCCIG